MLRKAPPSQCVAWAASPSPAGWCRSSYQRTCRTDGCHGLDGKGGVPNPNAKIVRQVPGLLYVADSYTKTELQKRTLDGQREIPVLDPKHPPAPLYMPPWRDKIGEGELTDLVEYLMSLMPTGEKTEF
jgi:hypothetical protein